MKNWLYSFAALFALLLASGASAQEPQPVPSLTGRVMDLTGTLTGAEQSQLEAVLQGLEAQKGSQVVVLIVPTTAPEDIAGYGVRIAHTWQLGRKGVDDGALLLVAKDDRALRIEVGRGLEGAIPDAKAKRIIEEIILPSFRDGRFFEGIQAGVNAIIKLASGEDLPPPVPERGPPANSLVPAIIVFFMLAGPLQAILGRFGAGAVLGGGVFWFLFSASLPFVYCAAAAAVLFIIAVFADFTKFRSGRGRHSGGGFSWGGGGGGGGGFRGGGGGFAGGGASGRW